MELTPLRRDAEPLMHSGDNASKSKDYHEFRHPDIQSDWNKPKSFKERFAGWRRTLLVGCVISVVVHVFNLGFALWAVQHRHVQNGQGVLYAGDCKKVRNAGIGFHLMINILSTALLGASNYCMQVLGAPTRTGRYSSPKRTMARHWCIECAEFVRNSQETVLAVDVFSLLLSSSPSDVSALLHPVHNLPLSANAYDVFAANGSPNDTAVRL
ncbi:hypothetical protein CA14_005502 [Aspergillus flavus]|uniref:DUF6536 domain-containing protein n=1 Tax=Aspergillus flavus TaxID=5059 RepID=A0AB74CGS9_ASPFL|nr:hypothetical protein CA14_005502 [Aspergillus flavus]